MNRNFNLIEHTNYIDEQFVVYALYGSFRYFNHGLNADEIKQIVNYYLMDESITITINPRTHELVFSWFTKPINHFSGFFSKRNKYESPDSSLPFSTTSYGH